MSGREFSKTQIRLANSEGVEAHKAARGAQHLIRVLRRFWPVLIELWMLAVLISFFVIRIVNSSVGRRIFEKIAHGRFR